MEDKIERIGYIMNLYAHVFFNVHHLDNEVFTVTIDEFKGTGEKNGKTVIYYPWDNEGAECPYEYVKESEDEVMELYKQAYNLREELYKKYEVVEKQKTKIRLIMNITEDYVSVETAKLLDKRGFDLLFCNNWHIDYDNSDWMDDVSEEDKENGTIIINQYHYPLITHQMVMKWLRELGMVITIQTKYPTNPELCKIPYSFLIEDYRPERDLQKEHGKYHTGYSSTAGMDDFLVKNNLLFDGLGFGEFKLYEQACEAAIKYCLENLI